MLRKNPAFAYGNDVCFINATLVGGGDAADLTVPADTVARKITNAALSGARTAEGVYDVILNEGMPPEVIQVIPHCEGAGHRAEITTAYVASTRTVVVTTRNSSGTADDLPTTDKLCLLIVGRDSTS